jgi:hypothetical protein
LPVFLVGFLVTQQLPHQARVSSEPSRDEAAGSSLDYVAKLVHEMELHHGQQCGQRIDALERLVDAKLVTLRTVIDSQADKVVLALASADRAVSKAEIATDKRFESVNEFRAALSDQTRTFVSKIEFDAIRDTNVARIADLSSRLDKTDGKSVGLNAGWIYLLGALAAVGTVVSIAVAFLLRAK